MTDRESISDLARRALEVEEIEQEDDTPSVGEWYETEWEERMVRSPSNPDRMSDDFFDADGPVIRETILREEDDEYWQEVEVVRRVLVCVTRVGSNFAEISTVGGKKARVHLDDFAEECTRVADPDQRIRAGVGYWQRQLDDASKTIAALMGEVGLAGRQLAPATQALAVSVGTKAAGEYKAQLAHVKETLPSLYDRMRDAGKEMGRWLSARAIPLRADGDGLKRQVDSIDRRLFAVDLYAGLSEDAEQVREGEPAGYAEPLNVFQGLHFMDEEAIAHYKTGGVTFDDIRAFDAWVGSTEHFDRLFPFPRCVVAFRVRRHAHAYPGTDPFVRMFLQARDKATFLYVRNGDMLWRITTEMNFGSHLYPDREHSKFNLGDSLYCTDEGSVITKAEYDAMVEREREIEHEDRHGWRRKSSEDYAPFNSSNVYFDDAQAAVAKDLEAHNRVAVLLQGLFDRSAVLHPHPPVQMWNAESFNRSVRLVYEADRAVTAGPPPDFEAFSDDLRKLIKPGTYVIGQYDEWCNQQRAAHAEKERGLGRYERFGWYHRRSENPGPSEIAQVEKIRAGKALFSWMRKSQRREKTWGGRLREYEIKDGISVGLDKLFNVTDYQPGSLRRFFEDPRTRAGYMQWAPLMLAAEEFHAGRANGRPDLPKEPVIEEEEEDLDAADEESKRVFGFVGGDEGEDD